MGIQRLSMRGYADSAWSWWLFVIFETSSICILDEYNPQRSVYIFQKQSYLIVIISIPSS